jgi:hypothetical protein
MSDVIRGQVDEGMKMLLDTGGEVAQRYLTVEMNRFPLVPFVIVFTKFDLASSSRNDYEERCASLFENVPAEIVSSIYSFACVAYKDCLTFVFSTAEVSRSYRQTSPNDRSTHPCPLTQNRCVT